MRPGRIVWALVGLAVLAAAALEAEARPGGGHTYSGGGGGGGGGGDGAGELVYLLIRLIIYMPEVGVPVTGVVVVVWIVARRSKRNLQDWDSAAVVPYQPPPELEQLRTYDPGFSAVLFEDFVYRLYAQAHGARAHPEALATLAPYLAPDVRAQLSAREPAGAPVTNVVIGAMRATSVHLPATATDESGEPNYVSVGLYFEANMTAGEPGRARTYYVVESWILTRAATAVTRPQEATRAFPCPNCGGPFQASDEQRCAYCGEIVTTGRFDWIVNRTSVGRVEERPPALRGTVPERGTDLPTVAQPNVDHRWARLTREDPALTEEAFATRLQLIYTELCAGWTALDLARIRPFVSDGLFDFLRYWIEAYQQQGLRNALEDMRVYHWTVAKVVRDPHFDAVTVRIWATGKDFTVEADSGKVVGGSRRRERTYTEYWTLIRNAGTRGEARVDHRCPNCGGALHITMAGTCQYCQAHITAGEFDWVLGKIEQDDSYSG